MSPASQQAWVERDGRVVAVPVDFLSAGDMVRVYAGDQIPVDGEVVSGKALVDQKTLTGEATGVPKEPGDTVYALTSVSDGQITGTRETYRQGDPGRARGPDDRGGAALRYRYPELRFPDR